MHRRMDRHAQGDVAAKMPSAYASQMAYDSIVHAPKALRFLIDLVGLDNVVLGTDYSFPPADMEPLALLRSAGLSAADVDGDRRRQSAPRCSRGWGRDDARDARPMAASQQPTARPGSAGRCAGSRIRALVTGQGRFTGDLPAALWVRFVRSPVAAGRIVRIAAPPGAMVVTAADLAAVKPIRPMLHKFNYVPVSQPVLAADVVRFVGEPVAAVVAPTAQEAEDIADLVEVEIATTPAVVDAGAALAPDAPAGACRGGRQRDRRGPREDAGRSTRPSRRRTGASRSTSARAGRTPRRWSRAPRMRPGIRPAGASTLTCATQMPHMMRTIIAELIGMPESELRVIAPDVGGGFGQKMSLRAGIRAGHLAGAQAQDLGRLDRGSAREPDRLLSQPRPVGLARRRVRRRRAAARAVGRHRRQYRRLFVLSDHLRRRAADGDGRDARALRRARVRLRVARRRSPTPARWRPIAACRAR